MYQPGTLVLVPSDWTSNQSLVLLLRQVHHRSRSHHHHLSLEQVQPCLQLPHTSQQAKDGPLVVTLQKFCISQQTLGARALEMGGNMSGTLKGQDPFTWHVSTRHILGTCVMTLAHFPYM